MKEVHFSLDIPAEELKKRIEEIMNQPASSYKSCSCKLEDWIESAAKQIVEKSIRKAIESDDNLHKKINDGIVSYISSGKLLEGIASSLAECLKDNY